MRHALLLFSTFIFATTMLLATADAATPESSGPSALENGVLSSVSNGVALVLTLVLLCCALGALGIYLGDC